MRPLARITLALLPAAALLVAACGTGGDSTPARSTIKIGAIVPFEGQSTSLGQSFLKAVQVAVDNLGDTKHDYELVIEDGGTTPQQSQQAARRLVDEHKVAAIVGGISKVGEWVAPIATAAKVPQICICSIAEIGDGQYNFTNIPLAEDEAEAWVAAAQARGVRTIAILAQEYPSIDGHVNGLKAAAATAGMQVVYEYRFPAGSTDFLKPMMAAGATNPDVYFISAYEPSLTAVGKQVQVARKAHPGTEFPMAGIVSISLSQDIVTFDGAWYTDSDLNPDLLAQFQKVYPTAEFITHMMPYAYDSVRMLVKGFESDQGVVEYLRNLTRFDGSAGPITRQPGTGNFRSKPVVWTVNNGCPQVEATGRTRPGCAPATDPDATPPANLDNPLPANPHAPTTN